MERKCDSQDEALPPRFLRTVRTTIPGWEREAARSLAEPWAGLPCWAQNCPASNDLAGGASGIARPVASARRPRQNSQDRSSIHPGSARSIASTRRSRRRTSSNEAKFIAWARIRACDRGCKPTGSHQKNLLSSSAARSGGKSGDKSGGKFVGRWSASNTFMLPI
jgi:hypothetical protein